MNSKSTKRRILIGACILIWVAVIFRFTWNENEAADLTGNKTSPQNNFDDNASFECAELSLDYQDPFFADTWLPKTNTKKTPSVPRNINKIVQVENKNRKLDKRKPAIPNLHYLGFQKSTNDTLSNGILSINGRISHVSKGDKIRGIEILHLTPDTIRCNLNDSLISVALEE